MNTIVLVAKIGQIFTTNDGGIAVRTGSRQLKVSLVCRAIDEPRQSGLAILHCDGPLPPIGISGGNGYGSVVWIQYHPTRDEIYHALNLYKK